MSSVPTGVVPRSVRLKCDRTGAYAGKPCRSLLRRRRLRHLIPEKSNEKSAREKHGSRGGRPVAFTVADYGERNMVGRCILRLKQSRRVYGNEFPYRRPVTRS